MQYSKIISTGSYLPQKILNNKELETMVDTTDEWIVSRSGIKERRIVAEGEKTSDMAYQAAINTITGTNYDKSKIDLILVATSTVPLLMSSPSTLP